MNIPACSPLRSLLLLASLALVIHTHQTWAGVVTKKDTESFDTAITIDEAEQTFLEQLRNLPHVWDVGWQGPESHTFKHVRSDTFDRLSAAKRGAWTKQNMMYDMNESSGVEATTLPREMAQAMEKALSSPLTVRVMIKLLFSPEEDLGDMPFWSEYPGVGDVCLDSDIMPCIHLKYELTSGLTSFARERFEKSAGDTKEILALLRQDFTKSFPSGSKFVVYIWDSCRKGYQRKTHPPYYPLLSAQRFLLLEVCDMKLGLPGQVLQNMDAILRNVLIPPRSDLDCVFPLASHLVVHLTPYIGPNRGSTASSSAGWIVKLNRAKLMQQIRSATLSQQEISMVIKDPSEHCDICSVGVGMAARVNRSDQGELEWSLDARVLRDFFADVQKHTLSTRNAYIVGRRKSSDILDLRVQQRLISAQEDMQVYVMEWEEGSLPLRNDQGREVSMVVGPGFAFVLHFSGEQIQCLERRLVLAVMASQFSLDYETSNLWSEPTLASKHSSNAKHPNAELIPADILRVNAGIRAVESILRRTLLSSLRNIRAVWKHGVDLRTVLRRAEFEEYTQRVNLLLYKVSLVRCAIQAFALDASLLLAYGTVHDADAIEQILRIDAIRDARALLRAASKKKFGNVWSPAQVLLVTIVVLFAVVTFISGIHWCQRARRKRKEE